MFDQFGTSIDAGGAALRRRAKDWQAASAPKPPEAPLTPLPPNVPTVVVVVTETHDGKPCDCIDKRMELVVGSEIELTHVCHDGRVDKVVARVDSIHWPPPPLPPEHGTVTECPSG